MKKQNVTDLLSILEKNQIKYQNFAASAQITITQPDDTRTINAKIRLEKDSVIWLSASLFGIEGARAILTPDSVKILNRLEQTYIAAPFSYFQKKYNVPLNFSSLQNILVGNVPDLNAAGFRATQDTLNYLLIKGLDAEQMQYTLDCRTQLLKGFSVSNLRMQEDLLILYNDYQLLNRSQQNIAHKRTVVAKNETNNIKVDIDMNRIQIDEPMNIEFEIPIGYKRTLP